VTTPPHGDDPPTPAGGVPPDQAEQGRGGTTVSQDGDATPAPTAEPPPAEAAALSPEALRAVSDEVALSFPAPFDESELVLMDVDPHRVHAYWHVAPADIEPVAGTGGPPLVLRVHDVTEEAPASPQHWEPFDIPVQGRESHCYVDLWQDGRTYEAELGVPGPRGEFVSLARSNPVHTPSLGPADEAPPRAGAPPPPLGTTAGHGAGPPQAPEAGAPGGVLDPAAVGAPAPTPGPEAPEHPAVTETALIPPLPGSLAPEFPNAAPVEAQTPPAEPAALGAGAEGPSPAGAYGPAAEGVAPPAAGAPGPAAADLAALSTTPIVTYSSSALGAPELLLEVSAEVHVYGRARPGTRLQLFGRPVPLRPDGSFSVRRPVPAGALVIPIQHSEPDPGAPTEREPD
jgi:hypothetical protein